MLKHWHDDMSTLLIVVSYSHGLRELILTHFETKAGLFSAVLTAFIIEFYRKLEPDYTAISAHQQHTMSINIQALLNASLNLPVEPIYDAADPIMGFQPSPAIVWTVGLWFSALACSISVVVLAWLVKLWFLAYMKGMNSGNAYDCAHRRQYRHNALVAWKVPAIVAALPVLIHMTITLFLIGLVILLWSQINSPAAYTVLVITILMILVYSITTLLPLFYEACPYKNTVLLLFLRMIAPLALKLKELVIIVYKCVARQEQWAQNYQNSFHNKHHDIHHERKIIQDMNSELTWKSIIWLLKYSQNNTAIDVALRSICGLNSMPAMMNSLFKVNITSLLSMKISMLLPDDLDKTFWTETMIFRLISSVSELLPYLQASFHLWTLAYLHNDYESLSSVFKYQKSDNALYGQWLSLWRELNDNKSRVNMYNLDESWNTGALTQIICNEALYYYLHPDNQLQIQEDIPYIADPLSNLHTLIESYFTPSSISYSCVSDLIHILDTISLILSKHDHDNLIFRKKSTLLLLLKLVGLLEIKYHKLCTSVTICLEMFSLKTKESRYKLLLDHYEQDKISKSYKNVPKSKVYIKLIQVMNSLLVQSKTQSKYNQSTQELALSQDISLNFLEFALRNNQDNASGEVLLPEQLSTANIYGLIDYIDIDKWTWDKSTQVYWLIDLLDKYYMPASSSYQAKIIALVGKLLCQKWSNVEYDQIYMKLFSFLTSKVSSDIETIYTTLVAALQHSLSSDPSRQLLHSFVSLKVDESIEASIQSLLTLQKIPTLVCLPWLDFLDNWKRDIELHQSLYTVEHEEARRRLFLIISQ